MKKFSVLAYSSSTLGPWPVFGETWNLGYVVSRRSTGCTFSVREGRT